MFRFERDAAHRGNQLAVLARRGGLDHRRRCLGRQPARRQPGCARRTSSWWITYSSRLNASFSTGSRAEGEWKLLLHDPSADLSMLQWGFGKLSDLHVAPNPRCSK